MAYLRVFLWRRLLSLGGSRVFLYSAAMALPIGVTLFGARSAWPPFIFEHAIVLLVVVCAVAGGRGPAVVAASTGSLGDNLLLREPVGWPPITGARDAVDFGLFLAVAYIVGWLVERLKIARGRAIEAAERERRALEERDRLVATVMHDLATPLNVIHGTLRVVRTQGTSSVDLAKLLTRVETAAARATSLTRMLADTQALQQQSLTLIVRPVDLRTVVERTATLLDRVSERHPIVLTMDSAPLVVNGDAERLERVLENLITNAIKYSPAGGPVEISVGECTGWATVTVRDHGIGLPRDATNRMFDPGYRAQSGDRCGAGAGTRSLHRIGGRSSSRRRDRRQRGTLGRSDVHRPPATRRATGVDVISGPCL